MLATIAALALGAAGVGLGAAGYAKASQVGRRSEITLKEILYLHRQTQNVLSLLSGDLKRSADWANDFDTRLSELVFDVNERLITRGEVSAAFAELAAIEEQRRQSAAAARTMPTAPPAVAAASPLLQGGQVPLSGGTGVDPWADPNGTSSGPPANPAVLISEITAMNERLRDKLRGAGVLG